MKFIIRKYLIVLLSAFITEQIVPAFRISDGLLGLLYASLYLAILMFLLRPVINIIMLPINLITLNLTAWIAGIIIVAVWTILSPHVTISAWKFPGLHVGMLSISPLHFSHLLTILAVSIILIVIIHVFDWFVG